MMIFGYWLTNIAGFMLMHHGAKDLFSKEKNKAKLTKRELYKDIGFSLIYTLLVIILVKLGWIKFPLEYFQQ